MTTSNRIGAVICAFTLFLMPGLALAQNLTPSDTVTVQLGTNNPGQNNGHLQVQYAVNGQNQNQSTESLIKFDLTALAAAGVTSSDIQSANLILFVNSGGGPGGNVTVCQLAGTWSSGTITGTNSPTCPNGALTVPFPVTSSQLKNGAFISVPVTGIVQSWVGPGATPNNGIELEADAPMPTGSQPENVQFDALASNGQGFAPMLQVVTGVASISTGSGLLVSAGTGPAGAGPASGADTLTINTGVIATNSSVTSAVAGGVSTAEGFATNAVAGGVSTAESFATSAANTAQANAESAANAAIATFATSLAGDFLSLSGGTVTGTVAANLLNSASTFQINSTDVLQADTSNNTASGFGALKATKTLSKNMKGTDNTAHGWNTLTNVSTGSNNTSVGSGALSTETTGSDNTAHGYQALMMQNGASDNTADGSGSLSSNTTGNANTAHGKDALKSEKSGNNNVAHGKESMKSHTSGDDNTAIGTQAGMNLQTGKKNILMGKLSGQNLGTDPTKLNESWNIMINNDGVAGDNNTIRIGKDPDTDPDPTDMNDMQSQTYIAGIKKNDQSQNTNAKHVLIDTMTGQLGVDPNGGQTTVTSVAAGTGLTAAGTADVPMLAVDTTVIATVAKETTDVMAAQGNAEAASLSLANGGTVQSPVEVKKLNSDTTLQIAATDVLKADATLKNTATGFGALSNPTGSENDAHGYDALLSLTTGAQNTAHGKETLKSETTGSGNTAHGYQALMNQNGANNNAAVGMQALLNELTGSNNVAHGMQTLKSHTSGDDNTAIGTQAGMNLVTGKKNILLGKLAGQNLTTNNESYNILINNDGVANDQNTIRIGKDTADMTDPNDLQKKTYIAGIVNNNLSSAAAVVIDSTGNLGTVQSSRRYKEDIHDMGAASDALLRLRPVTFRYKKPDSDGAKPLQYGLIAEEVAEVYPNLVVHGKDGQVETVQYYKLDAMLLNEVQKLSRANAADQAEIAELRVQVAEQLKQGREQQAAIKQLMAQVHGIQATVANSRSARPRARVANAATKKVQKKTTKPEVKHPSGQTIASLSVPMR